MIGTQMNADFQGATMPKKGFAVYLLKSVSLLIKRVFMIL